MTQMKRERTGKEVAQALEPFIDVQVLAAHVVRLTCKQCREARSFGVFETGTLAAISRWIEHHMHRPSDAN